RRQAVRTVPAPALGRAISRHRHRPRDRAKNPCPPWRAHLGGRGREPRRNVLFHAACMIAALLTRIEAWLFEPPDSLIGKPLWLISRILRYPYALARDIARGDLTLRAMSLVYTTLLSIVPLIALSFSVLKGLGFHRELEPVLFTFLEPLGDRAYELTAQIMQFVDNVQSGVLGSIGLIVLLYTVISMVQKV